MRRMTDAFSTVPPRSPPTNGVDIPEEEGITSSE
jgi:hypothetical protein